MRIKYFSLLLTIIFSFTFVFSFQSKVYAIDAFSVDSAVSAQNDQTGGAFGNFSCSVSVAQSGNKAQATVSINGDVSSFNRLGWKLTKAIEQTVLVAGTDPSINQSTGYPLTYTFDPNLSPNTSYTVMASFYTASGTSPQRASVNCTTNFNTSTGTLERVKLLGKIMKSPVSACTDNRYYYGDSCGNSNCFGSPNFSITWSQGASSGTINNSCFSNSPRYTFEDNSLNNPYGNRQGQPVTVTINAGTGVYLTHWGLHVSDADANKYGNTSYGVASEQNGYFTNPGPNQTITIKAYKSGGFEWNHLWFYYMDAIDQAACESISVPGGFVYAGTTFNASITMRNEGTTNWTAGNNYKLGSQDFQDNTTWGFKRFDLAPTVSIAPGQATTFATMITAPSNQSGNLSFNWQMIREGKKWFGEKCKATVKVVVPPIATITGPNTGSPGNQVSFRVISDSPGSGTLQSSEIWIRKAGASNPTTWGCATAISNEWCQLTLNTATPSDFSKTWTPQYAGTYTVAVNAKNSDGGKCTGNPDGYLPLFGGYCDRTNSPHKADYVTVSVCSSSSGTSCNRNSCGDGTGTISCDGSCSASTAQLERTSWNTSCTASSSTTCQSGTETATATGTKNVCSADGTAGCSVTAPAAPPCLDKQIINADSTRTDNSKGISTMGSYQVSGKTAGEGGKGAYNGIKVSQRVENGNASNVFLAGTAFVSNSQKPGNNTLYELTKSAYLGNGFVILWAEQEKFDAQGQSVTYSYYKSNGTTGNQSFSTAKRYYVYYKGVWSKDYNPANVNDANGFNTSPDLEVSMKTAVSYPAGPEFSIVLKSSLGNKTWSTYGYLLDSRSSGNEKSVEKSPAKL